jgi:ankyrin repeat protein
LEDEIFNFNYYISGTSPLLKAVTYPNDNMLIILLKSSKIDVNLYNNKGQTALSYTAQSQGASCIDTLLLHGANHAFQDNYSRCLLILGLNFKYLTG